MELTNRTRPCTPNRRARAGAALAVGLALVAASDLARADAVVRQRTGQVEIGRGEPPVWTALAVGTHVAANDRIRTGADGRVELAVDAGTLRVHENSLLKLRPALSDVDQVELELGQSLFDVIHREGRRFEVHTPTVVVSVKGTRFGVESSADADVVSVFRGVVGVHSPAATEVVETLVHEGFLAVGGGDRPFELEVMPAGDPWSAWQNFQSGAWQGPSTQPPASELERARMSLRRATDVDVVKRAAERKPEIAERLRHHDGDAKPQGPASGESKDRTSESPTPVPASPGIIDSIESSGGVRDDTSGPGGGPQSRDGSRLDTNDGQRNTLDSIRLDDSRPRLDAADAARLMESTPGARLDAAPIDGGLSTQGPIDARDAQRDIVDSQRARTSLDQIDTVDLATVTGGTPLPNGQTAFNYDQLQGYDPNLMMQLVNSLQAMQSAAQSSAGPWSSSDITNFLRSDLESKGVDGNVAQEMVRRLLNR